MVYHAPIIRQLNLKYLTASQFLAVLDSGAQNSKGPHSQTWRGSDDGIWSHKPHCLGIWTLRGRHVPVPRYYHKG